MCFKTSQSPNPQILHLYPRKQWTWHNTRLNLTRQCWRNSTNPYGGPWMVLIILNVINKPHMLKHQQQGYKSCLRYSYAVYLCQISQHFSWLSTSMRLEVLLLILESDTLEYNFVPKEPAGPSYCLSWNEEIFSCLDLSSMKTQFFQHQEFHPALNREHDFHSCLFLLPFFPRIY